MKTRFFKLILPSTLLIPMACTIASCSDVDSTIHIVALNDYHGAIEEYENDEQYESQIACLADNYANITKDVNNPYFILMGDNGDGSAISKLTQQKVACDLLSNFNPHYSVLGNHELYSDIDIYFDKDNENSFAKQMKLNDYLCCNAYWVDNSGSAVYCDYFKPYAIEKIGDLNVGFVGYTTNKEGLVHSKHKVERFYTFDAKDNETKIANTGKTGTQILQDAIDACHNDSLNLNKGVKPDVVILAQHEGSIGLGKESSNGDSDEIIGLISGIDASIEAHTHSAYNHEATDKTGKKIPAAQGDSEGRFLNELTIKYNKSKTHFDLSFKLHKTNVETKKGDLINKDSEIVKNVKDTLNKWYQSPFDDDYKTLYDKINNKLMKFIAPDESKLIIDNEPIGHNNFSEVSHVLIDCYLKMLNDTETAAKAGFEDVKDAIDEINAHFTGREKTIDGVFNNGGTFRKPMIPTGTDPDDNKVHYLKNKDMFDCVPYDEQLVATKMTVANWNKYFTTSSNRKIIADPFIFADYKMDWEGRASGKTYKQADKVWICKLDGTVLEPTESLVLASNFWTYDNKIKTQFANQHDHIVISNTESKLRENKEFDFWCMANTFPFYVNNYMEGVYDLNKYPYNEATYLYQ